MNVTSTMIAGADPAAGELLFVAHVFETIATPGANDNSTGVATVLEIARTLAKLTREGRLPKPRRTIRFLWVPEISGSRAFMFKHPELEDRLLAVLNFDMTGADLEKTDTYLQMKMSPDSRPHYINDLVASLLQFVDQTDIRTQQGNNAPFNYRLVPYIGASETTQYFSPPAFRRCSSTIGPTTSTTRARTVRRMADPTELKRVAFMGAAAFMYLANADAAQRAWLCAVGIGSHWREVDYGGCAPVRAAARRRARQIARAVSGRAEQGHLGVSPRERRRRVGARIVQRRSGRGCRPTGSSGVWKRFAMFSPRSSKVFTATGASRSASSRRRSSAPQPNRRLRTFSCRGSATRSSPKRRAREAPT